jgi:hypothetical protein
MARRWLPTSRTGDRASSHATHVRVTAPPTAKPNCCRSRTSSRVHHARAARVIALLNKAIVYILFKAAGATVRTIACRLRG